MCETHTTTVPKKASRPAEHHFPSAGQARHSSSGLEELSNTRVAVPTPALPEFNLPARPKVIEVQAVTVKLLEPAKPEPPQLPAAPKPVVPATAAAATPPSAAPVRTETAGKPAAQTPQPAADPATRAAAGDSVVNFLADCKRREDGWRRAPGGVFHAKSGSAVQQLYRMLTGKPGTNNFHADREKVKQLLSQRGIGRQDWPRFL